MDKIAEAWPTREEAALTAADALAAAIEDYAPEFYNVGPWSPLQQQAAKRLQAALIEYRKIRGANK